MWEEDLHYVIRAVHVWDKLWRSFFKQLPCQNLQRDRINTVIFGTNHVFSLGFPPKEMQLNDTAGHPFNHVGNMMWGPLKVTFLLPTRFTYAYLLDPAKGSSKRDLLEWKAPTPTKINYFLQLMVGANGKPRK